MIEEKCCSNCKFYGDETSYFGSVQGLCKRNPPAAGILRNEGWGWNFYSKFEFPETIPSSCCGEHQWAKPKDITCHSCLYWNRCEGCTKFGISKEAKDAKYCDSYKQNEEKL